MKSRLATFVVFLIGMMLVLLTAPLWADDGHGHNHGGSDVTVDASSVLDNSVTGDSSKAFGFSMGDVDINDCYRSYQVLVWQDSRINRFCIAQHYAAMGNEDAYARTMCSIKAVRGLWDSRADCIAAHVVLVPTAQPVSEHFEEEEEFHEEQQVLYADLQAKIANLEQEQNQEAARRRAVSRAVSEQREADKQYAKQALEELKQWK